jgi:hypothetical protein
MYDFYCGNLLDTFFLPVNRMHFYHNKLALQNHHIPFLVSSLETAPDIGHLSG